MWAFEEMATELCLFYLTLFLAINWLFTFSCCSFFGLCGVFVSEGEYMFMRVCQTFGSNDLMLFIKVGVKEEAAESISGLWLPIEAGCAPPAPTSCNENIINYPTDRPLGCGAGNSLGLVFVERHPPAPPPLTPREQRETGWKKTVYPSLARHPGWQRKKALVCLGQNGLNWQTPHGARRGGWSLLTWPFTSHLCSDWWAAHQWVFFPHNPTMVSPSSAVPLHCTHWVS